LRGLIITILVATSAVITATSSYADVIRFRDASQPAPTYTGAQDAGLFASTPNTNYGAETFFDVGDAGQFGGVRHAVVRFDISALAGQYNQINSITLNIFPSDVTDVLGPGTNTNTLQVFKVANANSGWTEGVNVGTTALTGESTWNNRNHPSTAWAGSAGLGTAGTDYDSTALASAAWTSATPVNNSGSPLGGGLTFGLNAAARKALIDQWTGAAPGGNGGVFLRALNEPGTGGGYYVQMRVRSSEFGTVNLRPELVIDYTPVPEPASMSLIALGAAMLLGRRPRR
jgi:hypothetical protein